MTESSPPRFPRVAVDVPPELADDLTYELFELGASGVEQRDESTLDHAVQAGSVLLLASFETDQAADAACEALDSAWKPRRDDVVGDAWRDGWKEHFKPFSLTPGIIIRPPWTAVAPSEHAHVLEMDPGRAFGTGLHATTRLVAQAIERYASDLEGRAMLDVGCGSGVLALCALVHGADVVLALDNDPEAVSATLENAERNGFAQRVVAETTDVGKVDASYPFVVANIETRVLIPMAPRLRSRVAPGGWLVLSGILADQAADVRKAYEPLRFIEQREERGWVSLEFQGVA